MQFANFMNQFTLFATFSTLNLGFCLLVWTVCFLCVFFCFLFVCLFVVVFFCVLLLFLFFLFLFLFPAILFVTFHVHIRYDIN